MTDLVTSTSWAAAILCFIVAASNAYFWRLGWLSKASAAQMTAWVYWGVCYIATQYGPDWFIDNQRAFFRLASAAVAMACLYYLYELYPILDPIIKANGRSKRSS